ncbi:hypothetical protein D3C84_1160760 [compost metagenome]
MLPRLAGAVDFESVLVFVSDLAASSVLSLPQAANISDDATTREVIVSVFLNGFTCV